MNKTLAMGAAALALAAGGVHAHEAGDIIVRAGAAMVAPDDSSSQVRVGGTAIGGKATVGNNTQLGITAAYMVSDKIGVELLAATPFNHKISLKGLGALDGKFADTKHLPPTVTLQYYPAGKDSRWQPYVGAGVNFTAFFNEKLTGTRKAQGFSDLSLSNSTGLALQLGSDFMITDRLMFNVAVWHVDLSTTARAKLNGAPVKVKVDIDPWVYMVGLGYRF